MKPFLVYPRQGDLPMFSFGPSTDPPAVLEEICWAYAENRQSICGGLGPMGLPWLSVGECPTTDGGYCCDCHSVAFAARESYRERFEKENDDDT